MTETIFNGPEGKLEGKYYKSSNSSAPIALILPDHMSFGGNMNSKVAFALFQSFVDMGFSVLRFNYRGVGKSQGKFDDGGEFADAAAALDWLQIMNKDARVCWLAGYSFGAWIGMQLLMRRPEIKGFISVSPPANIKDFSFLSPCPANGIIIQGTADRIVSETSVSFLAEKLSQQRGVVVDYKVIHGADHFFEGYLKELYNAVQGYVKESMQNSNKKNSRTRKMKSV